VISEIGPLATAADGWAFGTFLGERGNGSHFGRA
jgi:hypothetical protein